MKHSFLALALLLCLMRATSEDLIVTDKGDSINCLITRVKPDFIYFTFRQDGEVRNTLLPVGQVKSHQKNFYGEPALTAGATPPNGNRD